MRIVSLLLIVASLTLGGCAGSYGLSYSDGKRTVGITYSPK